MADNYDLNEQTKQPETVEEIPAQKAKGSKGKRKKDKKSPYNQKPVSIEPLQNEKGEYVCPYCKKVIDKNVLVCPHCRRGIRIKHLTSQYDSGDPFIALASFFLPILGIILFFYWRKSKPRNAKMAGIGALVFTVILIVLLISIRPAA